VVDRIGQLAVLAILAAVIGTLLYAGCHGTDLRLGVGRSFNDFSGSGGIGGDHGGGPSFEFDQDDSTMISASVGFQLTPQTVVIESVGFTLPSIPAAVVPAVAVFDPAPILALLASIEERLEAIETETEDHISWSEFGLSSVTGGGGLGLIALALFRLRRHLSSKKEKDS